MTDQLVFFASPTARRIDPATSHEAAAAMPPLGRLERAILACFADGAKTDEEVCELLPECFPPTVKTCRSRLTKRGLLVPTGARRPSSRGHDMQVWAVAP
jgi:hypothetical protein